MQSKWLTSEGVKSCAAVIPSTFEVEPNTAFVCLSGDTAVKSPNSEASSFTENKKYIVT